MLCTLNSLTVYFSNILKMLTVFAHFIAMFCARGLLLRDGVAVFAADFMCLRLYVYVYVFMCVCVLCLYAECVMSLTLSCLGG